MGNTRPLRQGMALSGQPGILTSTPSAARKAVLGSLTAPARRLWPPPTARDGQARAAWTLSTRASSVQELVLCCQAMDAAPSHTSPPTVRDGPAREFDHLRQESLSGTRASWDSTAPCTAVARRPGKEINKKSIPSRRGLACQPPGHQFTPTVRDGPPGHPTPPWRLLYARSEAASTDALQDVIQ